LIFHHFEKSNKQRKNIKILLVPANPCC